MAFDLTVACLRCAATVTVPATDRQSVLELLVDFGWQATKEGAVCHSHRFRRAEAS